jgi:transcriptional regulator with XRE-family HTH domain
MTIGEKIIALLKETGMTQKEFSVRTGIPPTTVSDWKAKKLNPSSDKILVICEVLEISPYVLLSGSDPAKSAPESLTVYRGSNEYDLVLAYQKLDQEKAARLLGYVDSLKQG